MRSKLFFGALAAWVTAAPLSAQVSVTPFVGVMTPLVSQVIDTAAGTYFRFRGHTVFGLQLGKQITPTLGLQVQGGVGNGDLEIASGAPARIQSAVWFADVRAKFRLMGNADAKLLAIAGAGWTQYSVGLFEVAHETDDSTKFAGKLTGLIGLGSKVRLGSRIFLSADLTDRIHGDGVEAPGLGPLVRKTQHDLTFEAGLAVPLGS